MKQLLIAVTKTSITGVREKEEAWILETMAAIKFKFSKKWKITPRLCMPVELFFGKGGRLRFVYIRSKMIAITAEEDEHATN